MEWGIASIKVKADFCPIIIGRYSCRYDDENRMKTIVSTRCVPRLMLLISERMKLVYFQLYTGFHKCLLPDNIDSDTIQSRKVKPSQCLFMNRADERWENRRLQVTRVYYNIKRGNFSSSGEQALTSVKLC